MTHLRPLCRSRANGLGLLKNKVAKGGIRVLYQGALGSFGATYVGHFPWFATYNFMDELLPKYDDTYKKFGRNALCGFTASAVSDTCSNSIRVLKTTKQTYATEISYTDAAKEILQKEGPMGLFGRGLQTRIMANGVQGMLFQYPMEKSARAVAKTSRLDGVIIQPGGTRTAKITCN